MRGFTHFLCTVLIASKAANYRQQVEQPGPSVPTAPRSEVFALLWARSGSGLGAAFWGTPLTGMGTNIAGNRKIQTLTESVFSAEVLKM